MNWKLCFFDQDKHLFVKEWRYGIAALGESSIVNRTIKFETKKALLQYLSKYF